jgi:hypothetical protein
MDPFKDRKIEKSKQIIQHFFEEGTETDNI